MFLTATAAWAGPGEDFYEQLRGRGMTHFRSSEYRPAFVELRIAGLGFVEQLDQYEIAQSYAAIAAHRLGNEALTRVALVAISRAETIQPRFRLIAIPDAMRSEILRLAPVLLTREEQVAMRLLEVTRPAAAH